MGQSNHERRTLKTKLKVVFHRLILTLGWTLDPPALLRPTSAAANAFVDVLAISGDHHVSAKLACQVLYLRR